MTFNPDSQDHSYNIGQAYPQMDKLARKVEELDQELVQMKRLLRVICYTLYYERENLADVDHAAMKLGLGPKGQKQKWEKKYDSTFFDVLEELW